jgi:DNA-binding NtrC family response regulator
MAADFEFLSPTDRPALLAISEADLHRLAKDALLDLGYKVQSAATHDEFLTRFTSVPYHLTIMEDTFASVNAAENASLKTVQTLPMTQRRHCTFILIGATFQTMNATQAFQQSAHAVMQPGDASKIKLIVQQAMADNSIFMSVYRDIQNRIAQGKA